MAFVYMCVHIFLYTGWLITDHLDIIIVVQIMGEKERYTYLNAEFQRTARRDKKAFLSEQCKEIEENKRLHRSIRD